MEATMLLAWIFIFGITLFSLIALMALTGVFG
jgi:hypothetical protein